jgi:hypothetical protein
MVFRKKLKVFPRVSQLRTAFLALAVCFSALHCGQDSEKNEGSSSEIKKVTTPKKPANPSPNPDSIGTPPPHSNPSLRSKVEFKIMEAEGVAFRTYPQNASGFNSIPSNRPKSFVSNGSNYYLGTDGGLSISSDSGTTWTTHTTAQGLPANQVNRIAVNGNTIAAATFYGLGLSTDGGTTWTSNISFGGVSGVAIVNSDLYALTQNNLKKNPVMVGPTGLIFPLWGFFLAYPKIFLQKAIKFMSSRAKVWEFLKPVVRAGTCAPQRTVFQGSKPTRCLLTALISSWEPTMAFMFRLTAETAGHSKIRRLVMKEVL